MANGSAKGTNDTQAGLTPAEKEALAAEMAELKQDLARLTSMVSDMAGSRYQNWREQAADLAGGAAYKTAELRDEAYARANALREEAYARAGAIEEEMQRTVRDRPLTSVAVAAAVGYLVGLLSRSHR